MHGRARALLHTAAAAPATASGAPAMAAAAALAIAAAGALAVGAAGCSSLAIARVQPENVAVGPGLRPVAVIQASAISGYLLFIPLPGGVSLDRVVNRMLIVAAKTIGADRIANLTFDVTPDGGVWAIRKLLGWRSAHASGVAVQVEAAPADPHADDGPEPAASPPPGPPPSP